MGLDVEAPWSPVPPEPPELLTGLEIACEVASPVRPVLVAEELAEASPELPEVATGLETTTLDPPAPPPESPMPALDPPVAVWAHAVPPSSTNAPTAMIAAAVRTADLPVTPCAM